MGMVPLRHFSPPWKKHAGLRSSRLPAIGELSVDYRGATSSSIFRLFFKIERHDPGDSLRGGAAGAEGVKRLLSHSSEFNREYVTVRR